LWCVDHVAFPVSKGSIGNANAGIEGIANLPGAVEAVSGSFAKTKNLYLALAIDKKDEQCLK
jgi:hypothetical protein